MGNDVPWAGNLPRIGEAATRELVLDFVKELTDGAGDEELVTQIMNSIRPVLGNVEIPWPASLVALAGRYVGMFGCAVPRHIREDPENIPFETTYDIPNFVSFI